MWCKTVVCALIAVCGLLIAVASLVQSRGSRLHRLQWLQLEGSVLWPTDLVALAACGPGIKSMSPALAGGVLTTGPPRKSCLVLSFFLFSFNLFGEISLLFINFIHELIKLPFSLLIEFLHNSYLELFNS